MERQLPNSEETINLLSTALEQTDDTVIITNTKGIIVYINPAGAKRAGYTVKELLGNTPSMFKSGKQGPEYYKSLWTTIAAGEVFRSTVANRRANGEIYWIEQTITPLKQKNTEIITHYVSVGKDVTDARIKQEQDIQLRLARDVQQQLYPANSPNIPGFDIAGQAYPADSTGGDYYDYIPMPQNTFCIAIGDVSGHGFDSALLMSETRAFLRAFMQTELDLSKILASTNDALAYDFGGGRYVTLLLCRICPKSKVLVYANAGHLTGYILDSNGNMRHLLESTGIPLGMFLGKSFPASNEIPLASGDTLLFLTDGITEAKDSSETEFGTERALEVVRSHLHESARSIVDALYKSVYAYMGNEPQLDDITCVICKLQ